MSGCANTRESQIEQVPPKDVIREPLLARVGDNIIVTLHREGEETNSLQVVVNENGTITLPLFGQYYVANKTCEEVAAQIKAGFLDERPEMPLQVSVNAVSPPVFFILGEVRAPGRYPYGGELTILEAIVVAGDFTDKANGKKVKLIRANGREKITLNLIRVEAPDPLIYPGDQIIVPRKWSAGP